MPEVWRRAIGAHEYAVEYDAKTTRWALYRCRADPRDDDVVASGRTLNPAPSLEELLDEIRDEVNAIAEEIRRENSE